MNKFDGAGNAEQEVFDLYIRKKTLVLVITYTAALLIALAAYTAVHFCMERSYRRTAEYGYEHAFEEVAAAAEGLRCSLYKASYASGEALSDELCADICGKSMAAEMTMAALPFSTQELEQTAAFMSAAADYARDRLGRPEGFDDDARAGFARLYKTAKYLSERLEKLRAGVYDGSVLFDEPENILFKAENTLAAEMLDIEAGIGSFSKAEKRVSASPVSPEAARRAAAEFFGLDAEQLDVEYTAENGSVFLGFAGGSICIDAQGSVVSLSSGRSVVGDMDSAVLEEKAREFLASRGFGEMVLASSVRRSSVLSMKFECVHNGVRCLDDYIKISIAADDGTVYAYDASAHISRLDAERRGTAAVDEQTARAAIPAALKVTDVRLCWAEDTDSNSVLCYGFDCTAADGERLFVLVNAADGQQHDIII